MSELQQYKNALEQLAKSFVVKSVDGKPVNQQTARAIAITKATKTEAGYLLAKRISQLEREQAAIAQYAPYLKSKEDEEDDEDDGEDLPEYDPYEED